MVLVKYTRDVAGSEKDLDKNGCPESIENSEFENINNWEYIRYQKWLIYYSHCKIKN